MPPHFLPGSSAPQDGPWSTGDTWWLLISHKPAIKWQCAWMRPPRFSQQGMQTKMVPSSTMWRVHVVHCHVPHTCREESSPALCVPTEQTQNTQSNDESNHSPELIVIDNVCNLLLKYQMIFFTYGNSLSYEFIVILHQQVNTLYTFLIFAEILHLGLQLDTLIHHFFR